MDPSSRGRAQSADLLGVNEAAFSSDARLDRVRRYIEENYPERILLADVAQVAGMERTAFSDFFRRETGIRFRDWLAAFKVTKSLELLSENNLSMKKVARKVGYDNFRSFERVFIRFVGRLPSEYRNAAEPAPTESRLRIGHQQDSPSGFRPINCVSVIGMVDIE